MFKTKINLRYMFLSFETEDPPKVGSPQDNFDI